MIHIWIRRTVDWANEDAAVEQLTDPWLKPKVPLWNATFNITYQRFRYRVAQIALLAHSQVEGARLSKWDEIPDGAVVLPVDDDDWFAPSAASVLERELDPHALGYVWTSRWIESPMSIGHRVHIARRRLLPFTPPKWICGTNNYAMLKRPEARDLLVNHMEASRWFANRTTHDIKRIDAELGVANRTLASQTTLGMRRHDFKRSELLRKYRRYRRLYRRPLPPTLAWCRPYVAMMADLMDELQVRT